MAKVLIIEDEKAMSDLIAIKFRVEGFEVEQAFSLAEAKEKLSVASFDAVLTDFLLPDGDLVDFLTAVRGDHRLQTLPIVVMTNYIEDINTDKLKSLGVSEILVKYQVVPAQMVEKIKQLTSVLKNVSDVPSTTA
ncbi:MAG: response regulator [Patescibacteria group bacterium]|nr:response regulator [Patescibacteria group bacterium]